MNPLQFLPKELEDIIVGYKKIFETIEHRHKFGSTLRIIKSMHINRYGGEIAFNVFSKRYTNEERFIKYDIISGNYGICAHLN